jgi:bacterial/archaeal transporter family protein
MHAWWIYALLSAFFASLTAILAKVGIKGVDSDVATAVRTCVILVIAWGIVFLRGRAADVTSLSRQSLVFLVLSGVATGMSWLCYFRALQSGKVTLVAPIDKASLALTLLLAAVFLGEALTLKAALGAGLILTGTLVLIL